MLEQNQKKLSQTQLDELYKWVDNLQLSRPKKNISRDFSDAVLMAQTISQYFPALVQLHNYPSTNSVKNKLENWKTLNHKTLNKLGIKLKIYQCEKLASSTPWQIQLLLYQFRRLCIEYKKQRYTLTTLQNGYSKNNDENRQNISVEKRSKKQIKGPQPPKIQDLKQILQHLKQKIKFLQKSIQRKDQNIQQLNSALSINAGIDNQ